MRFAPATFAPRRAKRRRYLRIVDKFNDQNVFAYVTAGHIKFLLLHEGRNEEAVRAFFLEARFHTTPETRRQIPSRHRQKPL